MHARRLRTVEPSYEISSSAVSKVVHSQGEVLTPASGCGVARALNVDGVSGPSGVPGARSLYPAHKSYSCLVRACAIAISIALTSCAAGKQISEVPPTFLEDVDRGLHREMLPFAHSWADPALTTMRYDKIIVSAVRTDLLPTSSLDDSKSTKSTAKTEYLALAAQVAQYFRSQLIEDLTKDPLHRFTVVERKVGVKGEPRTLILQVALTELELSHPLVKSISTATSTSLTAAAISSVGDPHLAFALRVIDASTGKLVATAADRRFPPMQIVDQHKLTTTSSVEGICAAWAQEIAAAFNNDGFKQIRKRRVGQ